jgi:methionyl-tRNA formyltransferase
MKISIIIDSEKNWFYNHAKKLRDELGKSHDVTLQFGLKEVTKGDIAFYLSCYELCPRNILDLHNNNIVIHASDLPKGKGWAPMPWQILEGKNEIVLSLFEAVQKVDGGRIYLKDKVVYDGTELHDELRFKLAEKIVEMAIYYVDNQEILPGKEQEGEESFYKRRTSVDSELDINKTIAEQFNLMRIVDNDAYPMFFIKDGVKYSLKIYKD